MFVIQVYSNITGGYENLMFKFMKHKDSVQLISDRLYDLDTVFISGADISSKTVEYTQESPLTFTFGTIERKISGPYDWVSINVDSDNMRLHARLRVVPLARRRHPQQVRRHIQDGWGVDRGSFDAQHARVLHRQDVGKRSVRLETRRQASQHHRPTRRRKRIQLDIVPSDVHQRRFGVRDRLHSQFQAIRVRGVVSEGNTHRATSLTRGTALSPNSGPTKVTSST